jgi:hypothetical protein
MSNYQSYSIKTEESAAPIITSEIPLSQLAGSNAQSATDPVDPEGSIRDAVRDSSGRAVGTVEPGHRITISGMEMTVAQALDLGVISHEDVGLAPEVLTDPQQKLQKQLDEALNPPVEDEASADDPVNAPMMLASDTEADLEALVGTIGLEATLSHAQSILYAADRSKAIGNLASSIGSEPEHVGEFVADVIAQFEDSTAKHITKHYGLKGADVVEWARDNLPKQVLSGISLQIFNGQNAGIRELVQHFKVASEKAERVAKLEALNAEKRWK